jgi:hypothetical protein
MLNPSLVELARGVLAEIFPDATEEGLDRGAEVLCRWSGEGIGDLLTESNYVLFIEDMAAVVGADPRIEVPIIGTRRLLDGEERREAVRLRLWRTTERIRENDDARNERSSDVTPDDYPGDASPPRR